MLHYLIDLFYPRLCPVCRKCLTEGEEYICSFCLTDFPFSDISSTPPIESNDPSFRQPEALYTLFYYNKNSPYRNLIKEIKYNSKKNLGVYLGKMLGEKIKDQTFDGIIPVPLHPKKEKKRGFNQSLQIARGIHAVTHTPIFDRTLIRVKNNPSQTGKNPEERTLNVENIFALQNSTCIENKHILLIDDVITTGSTLHSCIKALDSVHNLRISIACLAQTR